MARRNSEAVIPALQEAFAHPGPAIIDVIITQQELSLPTTITLTQATGICSRRCSGDGHEVLDMATNFWR